jgi:hypothetical protein
MRTSVDAFAFAAFGILLGICLCAIALCAFLLYRAAERLQTQSAAATARASTLVSANTTSILRLDDRLTAALAQLDAQQLHEAAQSIQRSALRLARATGMLHKLAYAQDGATAIAAEDAEDFDRESLPADPTPVDALNYQSWLRQSAQEKSRIDSVVRPAAPLPDLQEGFEQDDKDAELGLRSFMPEGF